MRFSLRIAAVAALAVATVAANAQIKFYYAMPGSTNRLMEDVVTSSSWTAEYDIVVENAGSSDVVWNAGALHVAYARGMAATGAGSSTPVAGTDKVTVFDTSNPGSNVTARPAWFIGNFLGNSTLAGGGSNTNPAGERPFGLAISVDQALGTNRTLAAGAKEWIARVKFKDNGFFGSGAGEHFLYLYTSPAGTSRTTLLLNGGTQIRPAGDNMADSALRLTPEPGTMLALAAGLGALAARRRRKA